VRPGRRARTRARRGMDGRASAGPRGGFRGGGGGCPAQLSPGLDPGVDPRVALAHGGSSVATRTGRLVTPRGAPGGPKSSGWRRRSRRPPGDRGWRSTPGSQARDERTSVAAVRTDRLTPGESESRFDPGVAARATQVLRRDARRTPGHPRRARSARALVVGMDTTIVPSPGGSGGHGGNETDAGRRGGHARSSRHAARCSSVRAMTRGLTRPPTPRTPQRRQPGPAAPSRR
jgi:hypothetical protein